MTENPQSQAPLTPAEAAKQAMAAARHLADEIGPRPVGSPQEAAAAAFVQDELRQLLPSGLEMARQEFSAPRSVWLPFTIACAAALLGVALWMLTAGSLLGAYLGALGCGFALWEIYAELNFGWSPLAGLVSRVTSRNVIASLPPAEGEGRNAIVFAHLDTQRTPIFSRSSAGLKAWFVLFYVALAVIVLTLLAFVASWFGELRLPSLVGIPAVVVTVPAIAVLLHTDLTPFTAGANDNASSVGVALALARHFSMHPLKNTHLWIVFTGAEETGCQGAGAFLDKYEDRLLQAYAIALEGVGVHKPAYSLREGMLGAYRSNSELVRQAEHIAKQSPELSLRPVKVRAGYTEAGMAIKKGYRAIAVLGMDENGLMPYWHSPRDRSDNLREEALAASFQAVATLLQRLDEMPLSIKLSQVKPLRERG